MIRSIRLYPSLGGVLVAAALLVAAAPASAAHVECGDVITQDTTLDSDLEACPDDGLVIGADDVTVDLNGHEIAGSGGGPIYGGGGGSADPIQEETSDGIDDSAGYDGLIVKGGEIEEFDTAVKLEDVTGALLTGLEPYATSVGVLLIDSERNRIEDNYIHHTGYGVYPVASSDNRIAGNRLLSNVFGMYPVESHRNRIVGNSVMGSGILGIQVTTASSDNVIAGNQIIGSGSTGLLVGNAYRNVMVDNLLVDHPGAGILMGDADGSVVRRNRIVNETRAGPLFDAQGYGVTALVESDHVTVERNTVVGYRIGYFIAGSVGIALSRNVARDSVSDGITLTDTATQTLVARNDAYGNGDDGIDVEDGSARVRLNRADSNGDLGIEAVAGVDGGGNRAAHNGNPAQCTGVACK